MEKIGKISFPVWSEWESIVSGLSPFDPAGEKTGKALFPVLCQGEKTGKAAFPIDAEGDQTDGDGVAIASEAEGIVWEREKTASPMERIAWIAPRPAPRDLAAYIASACSLTPSALATFSTRILRAVVVKCHGIRGRAARVPSG
jgi:hypothetical protein